MIIALIALLGTAALVMDVGFAWYAKRQVQASADAAALAGAQELPDVASATTIAQTYATKNTPTNLNNFATNITTRCSVVATQKGWCGPGKAYAANTIAVTETGSTPTWFAKVFGMSKFDVKGVATACQPCSSTPVDVEIVLDRTGSMCQPVGTGNVCTDLNNAKEGIRTLLGMLDPSIDKVGLVAFPPLENTGANAACASPDQTYPPDTSALTITPGAPLVSTPVAPNYYDHANLLYRDDALGDDFRASATAPALDESSSIVSHLVYDTSSGRNCIASFGYTSYADALQAGKDELDQNGRLGVPKVIVFMTDGEANIGSYQAGVSGHGYDPALGDPAGSQNMPAATGGASSINPGDAQPCHTAINVAQNIKSAGITVYAIGYGLNSTTKCQHGIWGQVDASAASGPSDTGNIKCVKIGTVMTGANKTKSWALHPLGSYPDGSGYIPAAGHWLGSSGAGSQPTYNPCRTGTHNEAPSITSYTTVQSIASDTVAPYFKNQATPGDVTAIFAAIGADITKGTSRLVDDSY